MAGPFSGEYTEASPALDEARRLARILDEPHIVAVRIARNRVIFVPMMLASFDELRTRGPDDIALYATVQPDGTCAVYDPFLFGRS